VAGNVLALPAKVELVVHACCAQREAGDKSITMQKVLSKCFNFIAMSRYFLGQANQLANKNQKQFIKASTL
jgi:hypothetical protein